MPTRCCSPFAAKCSLVLAALCVPAVSLAQSSTTGVIAGELVLERPTLIAQGFEWYVEGDTDGDAAVAVSWRKQGEFDWREGQPLLRINRLDRSRQYGPVADLADRPNLFAGSIFDLQPDTSYEARLVMSDADGANGSVERIVPFRTRAAPRLPEGGRIFHVYPPDHVGAVESPAFVGLAAAYFDGPLVTADHYNVYPPRVAPGDIILMHAGTYRDNWRYYAMGTGGPLPPSGSVPPRATCCGAGLGGTYYLTAQGTPDRPIVIMAAGDGEVVLDGAGNDTLINVAGGQHHHFEGITFRNSRIAIQAGWKNIAGTSGLTVLRSRFEDVGIGIHTDWSGSRDFYIADNTFVGRHAASQLAPFSPARAPGEPFAGPHVARWAARGVPAEASELKSEYAIKVYGSGHVVAYNRIENFHDGITHATYGVPDGWPNVPSDRVPSSNDFYNNFISNMHDDCIEVDGMLYNARVLRNLCVNAAGSGISTQGPALSGPVYIVRNIVYRVPGFFAALKMSGAAGLRVYNNTFVSAVRSNAPSPLTEFRNNLVLAEFPEEPAVTLAFEDGSPVTDYNGYLAGADAPGAFVRVSPGASSAGGQVRAGALDGFPTLQEWTAATGNDGHSRMIDFSVFADLEPADPEFLDQIYDPESLSFVLREGGMAIDRGVPLASVTEVFSGLAPDLGAIEFGQQHVHYGPRVVD